MLLVMTKLLAAAYLLPKFPYVNKTRLDQSQHGESPVTGVSQNLPLPMSPVSRHMFSRDAWYIPSFPCHFFSSGMLDAPYCRPFDRSPVDAVIECLVNNTDSANILAADDIKT
jgi:hypothetical protein